MSHSCQHSFSLFFWEALRAVRSALPPMCLSCGGWFEVFEVEALHSRSRDGVNVTWVSYKGKPLDSLLVLDFLLWQRAWAQGSGGCRLGCLRRGAFQSVSEPAVDRFARDTGLFKVHYNRVHAAGSEQHVQGMWSRYAPGCSAVHMCTSAAHVVVRGPEVLLWAECSCVRWFTCAPH